MCDGNLRENIESLASVVVATYNGARFIKEQILSIVQQDYKNIEVILTDDNSTDNTVEIAEQLLANNGMSYYVVRHNKNVGVVCNFKDGIRASHGDIIFLCDQDDYWEQDKVQLIMETFEKDNSVGLVLSNAYITDKDLNVNHLTLWKTLGLKGTLIDKQSIKKEMLKRNIFTGMSMAFRKCILCENDWFSDNMLHDEIIAWVAIKKTNIVMLETPTAKYRQHGGNVVGASSNNKFETIKKTVDSISKSNKRCYSKFVDINDYLDDKNYLLLNKAIEFYGWKSTILECNLIMSLLKLICYICKGYYIKFSSKTDYALVKDVVMIVFGRHKKW